MDDYVDFGACCACGKSKQTVRNLVFLSKRTPYGYGWGCLQCHLPSDGAVAIICDECAEKKVEIVNFIKGMPVNNERAPIEELVEDFDHDYKAHPEVN